MGHGARDGRQPCVTGVSKGFERKLEITGVGYKAAVQGRKLQLSLGYSHDIDFPIPEGITIVAPRPTELLISGIDRPSRGTPFSSVRGKTYSTRSRPAWDRPWRKTRSNSELRDRRPRPDRLADTTPARPALIRP